MLGMMMQKKSTIGSYDNNVLQGISLWDPVSLACVIKLCIFSSSLFSHIFYYNVIFFFCSPLLMLLSFWLCNPVSLSSAFGR